MRRFRKNKYKLAHGTRTSHGTRGRRVEIDPDGRAADEPLQAVVMAVEGASTGRTCFEMTGDRRRGRQRVCTPDCGQNLGTAAMSCEVHAYLVFCRQIHTETRNRTIRKVSFDVLTFGTWSENPYFPVLSRDACAKVLHFSLWFPSAAGTEPCRFTHGQPSD